MNKKLIALFAALVASVAVFAQEAKTEQTEQSAGLIGKSHVDLGFSYLDIKHTGTDAFGTGLNVNVPVANYLDVGFSYQHSWRESHSTDSIDALSVNATGYLTQGQFKPFGALSLGYAWDNGDNHSIWSADVGVQTAINDKLAVTVSTGYSDSFKNGRYGLWDATVGASYDITKSVSALAEVSYLEYGNFGYSIGLAYKF